ncbi:hypothetical protein BKP37_18325 [Anaerobacillus alkalilacustris]|uniref:Intracellular proteinase inhibitor BsuPI domain-containing protein n=1 Tax=Anaerobacillus alkalilacustris TaxID=393763 RepID=A0A1S2LDN5_9BACI|nr:BsuPI-related putative proteinase inhibitor [Anaerobacillus alkalilacustris]OIJ10491.1 hypothetical protein BKP37_18325 [Anaerobacillus alkalilacustris]
MLKISKFIILMSIIVIGGCGTSNQTNDNQGEEGKKMVSTNMSVYELNNKLIFELSLSNNTDEHKQLQFPSGQQFEITVIDENDNIVYRYSEGKMFIMAIVMKELQPSETLNWSEEWDMKVNGERISAGTYTAIGELQIMAINEESVEREQFKVEKTITVE